MTAVVMTCRAIACPGVFTTLPPLVHQSKPLSKMSMNQREPEFGSMGSSLSMEIALEFTPAITSDHLVKTISIVLESCFLQADQMKLDFRSRRYIFSSTC